MAEDSKKESKPNSLGDVDLDIGPFQPSSEAIDSSRLLFEEHDFYDKPISKSSNVTGEENERQAFFDNDEIRLDPHDGNLLRKSTTANNDTELVSKFKKPQDESDSLVRWLRHGDELLYPNGVSQITSATSEITTAASSYKRFVARMFDICLLTLILQLSLAAFLAFVGSTAYVLITQSLLVQLSLAIVLLPLALLLEAALLSDFGNTPGKYLLGLRLACDDQKQLKFRRLFKRSALIWLKGLACGVPIISLATLLWQRSHVTKYKKTSYDQSLGLQVNQQALSIYRKLLALMGIMSLTGLIAYLMPLTDFPDFLNRFSDLVLNSMSGIFG